MRRYSEENFAGLDGIREKIRYLYDNHPDVHVDVYVRRPRVARQRILDIPVVIKGVFPYVFQVEDSSSGKPKTYLHQYNDIATKEIVIRELEEIL